ncbi:hypothetical protein MJO28_003953 [Puccinia striiformis f. sp. tritici]|uniref:Uncharacterized protein n=1 Tax=Puccinia striiformis f. sp. tritici TaxID=168172 RepID=A0ACC0EPP1_9BASI|nr:hypothetical protein MJO28_003953 [Puccinia striiformis f. sp. tritici]
MSSFGSFTQTIATSLSVDLKAILDFELISSQKLALTLVESSLDHLVVAYLAACLVEDTRVVACLLAYLAD